MELDERTLRLIAVGASISANCQPCLQINVANALACGVDKDEIVQAIDVGRKVRQGAASKMDSFAAHLHQVGPSAESPSTQGCGCSS